MMVHYELFRTFDRGIGQAAFACVLRFFREKPLLTSDFRDISWYITLISAGVRILSSFFSYSF